jgi:hypothetical protein
MKHKVMPISSVHEYAEYFHTGFSFQKPIQGRNSMKSTTQNLAPGFLVFQVLRNQTCLMVDGGNFTHLLLNMHKVILHILLAQT